MTDAAEEDEEMEDGVHIFLLVESIEDGTCDVGDTLGDEPDDGGSRDGVQEGLEGHQHTQPHTDKTESLNI